MIQISLSQYDPPRFFCQLGISPAAAMATASFICVGTSSIVLPRPILLSAE
jgi:hypothetical protein